MILYSTHTKEVEQQEKLRQMVKAAQAEVKESKNPVVRDLFVDAILAAQKSLNKKPN